MKRLNTKFKKNYQKTYSRNRNNFIIAKTEPAYKYKEALNIKDFRFQTYAAQNIKTYFFNARYTTTSSLFTNKDKWFLDMETLEIRLKMGMTYKQYGSIILYFLDFQMRPMAAYHHSL